MNLTLHPEISNFIKPKLDVSCEKKEEESRTVSKQNDSNEKSQGKDEDEMKLKPTLQILKSKLFHSLIFYFF